VLVDRAELVPTISDADGAVGVGAAGGLIVVEPPGARVTYTGDNAGGAAAAGAGGAAADAAGVAPTGDKLGIAGLDVAADTVDSLLDEYRGPAPFPANASSLSSTAKPGASF